MISLNLPWPNKVLNPNVKCHWSKKSKARKAQKDECYYLTKQSYRARYAFGDRIGVVITFCPPDARRRDLDNALAACKGLIDGIALALGVDDSRFNIAMAWGIPIEGGMVLVTVN